MTVVTRDSIYDLDKCISQRTKAENERDKLVKENEALKVKLGVAVETMNDVIGINGLGHHQFNCDPESASEYQPNRDGCWRCAIDQALQTIQGENKC